MEIYHPKDEELLREMKRVRRTARRKRWLWGTLVFMVLGALFGWFVFSKYVTVAAMHGSAMGSTLPDGSLVVVYRDDAHEYQKGDIILYETDTGYKMKRVTATAGDRVVVNPVGTTRINGEDEDAEYLTGRSADVGLRAKRLTVEDQQLFVEGDQRSLSVDNRYPDVETIAQEKVVGRAILSVWPLYTFGSLIPEGRADVPRAAENPSEATQQEATP